MVKDIRSGTTSSNPSAFFVLNDEVHFEIDLGSNGIEIWKTNGTSSGTVKATNSACGHYNCNFHSVIEYNGSFYGAGHWNYNGREVLMYNSSGLSLLVDLSPGHSIQHTENDQPEQLRGSRRLALVLDRRQSSNWKRLLPVPKQRNGCRNDVVCV